MNHLTIYCRHTDSEGNRFVREHRVWDVDLFLKAQADACEQVRLKKGGSPACERIIKAQYIEEK